MFLKIAFQFYCDFVSIILLLPFLPVRRYASAVFATATCPAVCPSICHMPVLCQAERKQDREVYTI